MRFTFKLKTMSKQKITIEDYLALLFAERPDLDGSSIETVCFELNKKFNSKYTYKEVSLVYEPIVEFDVNIIDEEEDYWDGY